MRGGVLHKNHKPPLDKFITIELLPFSILQFCVEHILDILYTCIH